MSVAGDVLFDSVGQALRFAFLFKASVKGASVPGAVSIGSGRGLVGLDGAGEAGNIKRLIGDLPKVQAAALQARFSERVAACPCCMAEAPAAEWLGCCVLLSGVAMGAASSCHEKLALDLTMRHFGDKRLTFEMLGGRYGCSADQVRKINNKVAAALRAVEHAAQAKISDRLIASGYIDHCQEVEAVC